MTTVTKSKSLYNLVRPVWLDAAGMSKGINHDRQHLGIILAAGQTLAIRQTNPAFEGKVTLRLLNDDSKTEATFTVGSTWVKASVNAVSVPFIDTPYGGNRPVVEFAYPDTSKPLPIYRKGENEAAFFSLWDSEEAEFALVESDYANLLVPKISKKELKALGEGQNIDGLIAYYARIFTFYNTLAGLSFEPERASDLNIANRYFIKAHKNGAGSGYYGNWWTAESSGSISSFWLQPIDNKWGNLHEIAHGYQGNFMRDKTFDTREVWNNIYAACYQEMMLGERKYQQGWLYHGGKAQVEKTITDLIAIATPLNQWDLRSKLYFFMMILTKAGWYAFTHFNQYYREQSNQPGFFPDDHLLLDMLSRSCALTGERIDVTPFIRLAGGHITSAYRDNHTCDNAKAVLPLYQFVEGASLDRIKAQLKLDSPLCLVDATQLKASGLKGTVTLNFMIDDFSQIDGADLVLMEGTRYAFKTRIDSQKMVLQDVPIGVYRLRLPTGKDSKYYAGPDYLVVKEGDSAVQLDFVKKVSSPLITQQIKLLGLGDDVFATVTADYGRGKVAINVIKTTPHSHYPEVTYAKISLYNACGKVMFSKDIHGTNASLSHNELPFTTGDRIEIYHCEPQRLLGDRDWLNTLAHNSNIICLELTQCGLKNTTRIPGCLTPLPAWYVYKRLEKAVAQLRGDLQARLSAWSPAKDDIYLAVNLFDAPFRQRLLNRYQDCLPADNDRPGDYSGDTFTIAGKGVYNCQFLTGVIDLAKKSLTVKVEKSMPHNAFKDIYMSLVCEDKDGIRLFRQEIVGSQNQEACTTVVPLSGQGGEIIRLFHQEPTHRLVITNDRRKIRLPARTEHQAYRITTQGLERIIV